MWERAGLALVLLVAGVLDFWQLNRVGYGNTYYAAAVKSMLQSWHNFFFNAFDPGGFVTIDKPPLGFWLQVASAKVFGFSGLSLMLPQALAGVLSVAVLYRLVSRTFGTVAGLLAALALAAGSIVYVVSELLHVGRRFALREVSMWGIFVGFLAGYGTDLILTWGGA